LGILRYGNVLNSVIYGILTKTQPANKLRTDCDFTDAILIVEEVRNLEKQKKHDIVKLLVIVNAFSLLFTYPAYIKSINWILKGNSVINLTTVEKIDKNKKVF